MTPSRLRAAGDTHTGLQRDNNEDRFFFDDRHGLFCVIDGVGGHHAGERAAEIAAETLRTRLVGVDGGASAAARLREAFAEANDAIFRAASGNPSFQGMACVATVVLIDGERLRFGHVGDTRLFKVRGGVITKLTHDHSPVGELEDSGALTEVEAMGHPRRNEIYRDLGSQARQAAEPDFVELGEAPFERDSALVLCSDGLSDLVSSGSMRRIVESRAGSPALAVQELIVAANDAGGKDNVTAIVVEGEAFAEAVVARSRGPGRGPGRDAARPRATPEPRPVSAPRPAPTPLQTQAVPSSRPRGFGRLALALVVGLVVGAAAVVAAALAGWDLGARLRAAMTPASGHRTLHVGLDPAADFPTIGEALAQAAVGDTVMVGPGEYREALNVPNGVSLVGTRDSVLRPPIGARPDWVAITVQRATHGRVAGFLVAPGPDQSMAVGLVVEEASIVIEDLEITGAARAGVEFRRGARPLLRLSFVHGNPGAGVIVRAQAEPRLEFNVILHNGSKPGAPAPGVLVEPGGRPLLVANGVGSSGGPAIAGPTHAELLELARQNVVSPPPAAPIPAPAMPRRTPRSRTP